MIRSLPDIPLDVAQRFVQATKAYHAEANPLKRNEIAAGTLHVLRGYYRGGRLRLVDVKSLFEKLRNVLG